MNDNEIRPHDGDAAAIIKHTRETSKVEQVGGEKRPWIFSAPAGVHIHSELQMFEETEPNPLRPPQGIAKLVDEDSFVAWVTRFAIPESTVIVADMEAHRLRALVDYHEHSDGELCAGWCRFGADLVLTRSKEFLKWRCAVDMSVRDFAEFIDDCIGDVRVPDEEAKKDAKMRGAVPADPSKMLELARGITIKRSGKVTNEQNLSTGEAQVVFDEKHSVIVPSYFLLGIPMFERGPAFRLPARLRYRLVGDGEIRWTVKIPALDRAVRTAFDEIAQRVDDALGEDFTVLHGDCMTVTGR